MIQVDRAHGVVGYHARLAFSRKTESSAGGPRFNSGCVHSKRSNSSTSTYSFAFVESESGSANLLRFVMNTNRHMYVLEALDCAIFPLVTTFALSNKPDRQHELE